MSMTNSTMPADWSYLRASPYLDFHKLEAGLDGLVKDFKAMGFDWKTISKTQFEAKVFGVFDDNSVPLHTAFILPGNSEAANEREVWVKVWNAMSQIIRELNIKYGVNRYIMVCDMSANVTRNVLHFGVMFKST